MRKTAAVTALRRQRAATLARLAQLPDRSWDAPCLHDWRIRDVAAHLIALDEASVRGRLVQAMNASGSRLEVEAGNQGSLARWADRSPAELLDALEQWGNRLARLVDRLPSAALRLPFRGPYGRQPLLFVPYRRVLDGWVHECDVAWATDPTGDREPVIPDPGVPDVLAAAVLASLPHLALPRAPRTSGVVRLVVNTAEEQWRTWSVDFARRQYGSRVVARPDAVVRTDALTLALLAEARWSWAEQPRDRISVEGDEDIAAALLDVVVTAC